MNVFETSVQPRYRDLNPGYHVDSVECIRLLDEARQNFLRFADLPGVVPATPGARGLYGARPEGVIDIMAAQRVEYRHELRFTGFEPHAARLWISRIGSSSFEISGEVLVTPGGEPAFVGTCTMAQRDPASGAAWRLDAGFIAALEHFAGDRVPMRD